MIGDISHCIDFVLHGCLPCIDICHHVLCITWQVNCSQSGCKLQTIKLVKAAVCKFFLKKSIGSCAAINSQDIATELQCAIQ